MTNIPVTQLQPIDAQMDTQGSLASTFDVSTTPKTTPFLTTPNFLSPIDDKQEDGTNMFNLKFFSKEDQKPSDIALTKVNLIIDRMTAGIQFKINLTI